MSGLEVITTVSLPLNDEQVLIKMNDKGTGILLLVKIIINVNIRCFLQPAASSTDQEATNNVKWQQESAPCESTFELFSQVIKNLQFPCVCFVMPGVDSVACDGVYSGNLNANQFNGDGYYGWKVSTSSSKLCTLALIDCGI